MLNLIEGSQCRIESLDGSFEPFEVHYAETFIVPAKCNKYKIVNETGFNNWCHSCICKKTTSLK